MPITNSKEWELYRAAAAGNVGAVNELISQKMNDATPLDLDMKFDDDGTTSPIQGTSALYMAAKLGHVEIVELLLKAGAKPNRTCRKNKWPPLSIVATGWNTTIDQKTAIVTLLLEHGANPDLRDIEGATPIDHFSNRPAIVKLLKKYSRGDVIHFDQARLIQNYNILVDALRSQGICDLTNADKEGICAGLSLLYIFYEKQNRSDEFIFFLSFVNSLTAESIHNLIEQYKKDKFLEISVANSNSDEVYSFTKLLYFMEGVNRAQHLQLKTVFKSIQANWDSARLLAFTKENKDDILIKAGVMNEGEFKLISVGNHLIALHRTPEGTFIYDPNDLKGPILCRMDEYDLEQMITPYFSPEGHIILSVFDISYGDINRELDDIIADFKEIIQADEIMRSVCLHYQAGKISRTDLAYCLQTQLNDIINDAKFDYHEKLREFYLKINMYIETKQEKNIISPEFGFVDKTHSSASLLHTACRYGKLDLVKHLITNCGADINNQDSLGKLTPLITAAECGQVSVVKQLLKMGADPTLKSEKGNTPLTLSEKNFKKGGTYPIIAKLISSHLAMLKIIKESEVVETDSVAIKLAKCFKTYAHPPLLSLHWRSHRKLADSIAKTLSENNQWSAEQCGQYIKEALQDKKVTLNNNGTFAEVMHCANALIDQQLHREESSQPIAEMQQAMK